jgi:hypothetical protein
VRPWQQTGNGPNCKKRNDLPPERSYNSLLARDAARRARETQDRPKSQGAPRHVRTSMATVIHVAASPRSIRELSAHAHLLRLLAAQELGLWQRAQLMPQACSLVAILQIGERSSASGGIHTGTAAEASTLFLDAFATTEAHLPTHYLTNFVNGELSLEG